MRKEHLVLVHGYGDHYTKEGRPDVFSRIQVLAASEFIRRDVTGKRLQKNPTGQKAFSTIPVFTAGVFWEEKGQTADLMAEQLHRNLPTLPHNHTLVFSVKPTTRSELHQFADIADFYSASTLTIIGISPHLPRIKRELKRVFGNQEASQITIKSSEEILMQDLQGTPVQNRYKAIIKQWKSSPQYRGFVKRERFFINPIDAIPFIGGKVLDIIDRILKNKTLEDVISRMLSKL